MMKGHDFNQDTPLLIKPSSFFSASGAVIALLLVSFGQPAWSSWAAFLSAAFGYALFWHALLGCETARGRFLFGFLWFTAVQMVQLSWFLSHPFFYIWGVWLFFSVAIGLQFGCLSFLFVKEQICKPSRILLIISLWVIMEWGRLFFLAGYTWNPVGLALVASDYSLQLASLIGVFGLSFWVIMTNLCALRAWLLWSPAPFIVWLLIAAVPYGYGYVKISRGDFETDEKMQALLVQTAFPVEEAMHFQSTEQFVQFVMTEWEKILAMTANHLGKKIDLIVLPEFVVPLGTYSFAYPYEEVKAAFLEHYGPESAVGLPPLKTPWAIQKNERWLVNNAFWTQGIANCFRAGVVVGLEDVDSTEKGWEHYSCAIYIEPQKDWQSEFIAYRYAKRVLVPMGEYIPFQWCKNLAARYGVTGSFTPGGEAQLWHCGQIPFSPSICYEETFGHLMRESRLLGAHVLINLTNDGWYPNSRLPRQHLDHSKLRTVENGVGLLRACNTGITCALDAFGREAASLGGNEGLNASLFVDLPLYNYSTLYALVGDKLIIGLCLFFSCLSLLRACSKSL